MSLLVNIAILLLVGFINDSLSTYYIRLIAERRAALATLVNFIHGMVGWTIWIWFMHQFQSAEAMTAFQMFIYCLGGAAGTYMGLRGAKPNYKMIVGNHLEPGFIPEATKHHNQHRP